MSMSALSKSLEREEKKNYEGHHEKFHGTNNEKNKTKCAFRIWNLNRQPNGNMLHMWIIPS